MNVNTIPDKKMQELKKLIAESGNGFQYRVVKRLRELGWKVLVSPYYSDQNTDKPREIDIIAEKNYEVKSIMGAWLGSVTVRLFLECKYITNSTVFWFDRKDGLRARERVIVDGGYQSPGHNHEIGSHHYSLGESVAKLSTTRGVREDGDPIYKAVSQSINAMVYYRHRSNIFPLQAGTDIGELHCISYPIIIVNSFDEFFGTGNDNGVSDFFSLTEPFQLEVNYAYLDQSKHSQNEYFILDVVSIDQLEDFIAGLEKTDITPLKSHLSFTEDPSRRWERE